MNRTMIVSGFCLFLASAAAAHEGHHHKHEEAPAASASPASTAPTTPARSEFAMLWDHLSRPEYLHVLINPLPGAGMTLGVILLLVSLFRPRSGTGEIGLGVVLAAGVISFPTIKLGQSAYDRVFDTLTPDARLWLDVHMARAEKVQLIFYLAAVVAGWALVQSRRQSIYARKWTVAALGLATLSMVLTGWIAHAGGQVRHSEFREGPPPISAMSIVPTPAHGPVTTS